MNLVHFKQESWQPPFLLRFFLLTFFLRLHHTNVRHRGLNWTHTHFLPLHRLLLFSVSGHLFTFYFCYNKLQQAQWLKNKNLFPHRSVGQKSKMGLHWAKIKVLTGLCSFWRLLLFPCFVRLGEAACIPCLGFPLFIFRAAIAPPLPRLPCLWPPFPCLLLSLVKTCDPIGPSRIISPSQDSYFNHICKGPFAMWPIPRSPGLACGHVRRWRVLPTTAASGSFLFPFSPAYGRLF